MNWSAGMPAALGCQYRVEEVEQRVPYFPPRREFRILLRRPPQTVTADAIINLTEIPAIGEVHANPLFRVSKRIAVKIGPACWHVAVHFTEIDHPEREVQ